MNAIARLAAKFTARLALLVASLAPAADAAPIALYDSITGNTPTGAIGFDSTILVGNQFKTDAQSYSLDTVVIDLRDIPTIGTVSLDLYSDASAAPADFLASLTAPGTLQTGLNTYTASGVSLAAGQSFWVVLSVVSSDAAWQYSAGATVAGPGASTFSWTSDLDTLSNQPFMMQVNATPASNVPEIDPAGLGSVVALVTGVLALVERRKVA